jgi:hypothetical protein
VGPDKVTRVRVVIAVDVNEEEFKLAYSKEDDELTQGGLHRMVRGLVLETLQELDNLALDGMMFSEGKA